VALIDRGQVVAIDTPAALAERAQAEQRIQFRPSVPFDDGLLTSLPEVTSLSRRGDVVIVTGTGDALLAVITTLSASKVTPRQLRVDQGSLEDAFLELTGRHDGDSHHTTEGNQ
jgi:ABC-2 type transport system ATP-binding protein